MSLELPHFYGREAEQHSFYHIPKILLIDQRYRVVHGGQGFIWADAGSYGGYLSAIFMSTVAIHLHYGVIRQIP